MPKLEMVRDGHLGGYIHGGDPGTWCPNLWSWVVRQFRVRSVLDVGCGEGHSTRFFQSLGCEVTGLEGCQRAIDEGVIPGSVVKHDFCTGPYIPDRPFDLIWSCEFLEHVEARYVDNVLRTFAHAGKLLLVTHAFPGQDDGHHHVNCQPTGYWIRQVERAGLVCDVNQTCQARRVTLLDYPSVNHFARSGLLFARPAGAAQPVGELRDVPDGVGGVAARLSAAARGWHIHTRFRWSQPFREHMWRRRQAKRAARLKQSA